MNNAVGVFVKLPEPGDVKTRLGRDIGMERATSFYAGGVAWLLKRIRDASLRPIVFFAPPSRGDAIRSRYGDLSGVEFVPQRGDNLGRRMYQALEYLRENDVEFPVLTGSDTPLLPVSYLETAIDELQSNDLVLGPAYDGGYYLVGMNQPNRELFVDMEWSHENVLDETLNRADDLALTVETLPEYNDVDTVEDLRDKGKRFSSTSP